MLISLRYVWGEGLVAYLNGRDLKWFSEATAMLMENGWRVFLASFLAIIFAETADTEIFHYYREKSWIGRVIRSNAVSIPVDSVLFNLIAFAGSSFFPPIVLAKVILGEIVSKFVVGVVYAALYPGRRDAKKS